MFDVHILRLAKCVGTVKFRDPAGRQAGRHDWFYYTSTKCAIPDDIDPASFTPSKPFRAVL